MLSEKERRSRWLLLNICLLGGALLTFIGIRYFLVPHAAARTFGVPGRPTGFELHYILGLRNVWLGLLAVALALMREWRALALWFAGATVVCFSDAWIASRSLGGLPAITFHVASGAISLVLGILCWRTARRAAKTALMPE
jgi:hypothetical protein